MDDSGAEIIGPTLWPWLLADKMSMATEPDDIQRIQRVGTRRCFKKGSVITQYGESVSGIYFLTKGEVTGRYFSASGAEKVIFIFRAPCFFNEALYLANLQSNMELEASADSELTYINKNTLDRLLTTDAAFNLILMKYMARKTRLILAQLIDIITLSPVERVRKVLLLYARDEGIRHADGVHVFISQEELATITGLHRVTVAKAFRQLKDNGLIIRTSKSLVVLAP